MFDLYLAVYTVDTCQVTMYFHLIL